MELAIFLMFKLPSMFFEHAHDSAICRKNVETSVSAEGLGGS